MKYFLRFSHRCHELVEGNWYFHLFLKFDDHIFHYTKANTLLIFGVHGHFKVWLSIILSQLKNVLTDFRKRISTQILRVFPASLSILSYISLLPQCPQLVQYWPSNSIGFTLFSLWGRQMWQSIQLFYISKIKSSEIFQLFSAFHFLTNSHTTMSFFESKGAVSLQLHGEMTPGHEGIVNANENGSDRFISHG